MDKQNSQLEMALAANKAIGDVLKIIGRSPIVLTDVFEALLSNALELCEAEMGLFLLHEDNETFRAVHTKGVSAEFGEWWAKAGQYKPGPDTGLGLMGHTKKPMHIHDVTGDGLYKQGDPLRIATVDLGGARTFVAIPMLAGDELKGAFTLYRTTVRPFDEDHIQLVERFADQAVIAMENARLLQETRDLTNELSMANEQLEAKVNEQVIELERHARLTRFLPDQIAGMILESGDETVLQSHRRMIATIFCDLRRFTAFSESADPEEVIQVLETFHTRTSELTAQSGGTVIQRAGDGVMIILNDPIPIDEPAAKAVALAAGLRGEIKTLCDQWRSYDYDLGFGIGMSYGYATLGLVGSQNHQNYTAIGPSVNIASRLCDHASDGEVLATQRVRTEAPDFQFDDVGQLELKGVSRPMSIFKLQ